MTSLLALLSVCILAPVTAIEGGMSLVTYAFPEVGTDLTRVTWEHAVNSKQRLAQALQGDAMMLEADVSVGQLEGVPGELGPIMAHPPANTSDLSLEQFLKEAFNSSKGVKLDFKSHKALSKSEEVIEEALARYDMSRPLLLNADIIPGPINCQTTPVDPDFFLSTCVTKFPMAILSLGWTTCYGPDNFNGSYRAEDVERMSSALTKYGVVSEVTFAVRAGLAAKSVKLLKNLVRSSVDATLTVWSSNESDPVDVGALRTLIDEVGRDRVYLDLTPDLQGRLQAASASGPRVSTLLLLAALVLGACLTL